MNRKIGMWIWAVGLSTYLSCNSGVVTQPSAPAVSQNTSRVVEKPPAASASTSAQAPLTPAASALGATDPKTLILGDAAVQLGEPFSHENLTVFPLVARQAGGGNPYLPLDEAMDKGVLTVTEKADASVPTLLVSNRGKEKVFIMTGEIVTGARQDRMSAHDVLLPPDKSEVNLSVYCVEQGRWVETSRQFSAGKTAGTSMLRKTAARKGGQGEIWSKVAAKSNEASVNSTTGTMQAVHDSPKIKNRIALFTATLMPKMSALVDVVGFAAAIDGKMVSVDLFADTTLMKALWPKLLQAAAIDAVTSPSEGKSTASPGLATVRAFLLAGINGSRTQTENPGLGEEYLIESPNDISGTILVFNRETVHLSLFGPDRDDKTRSLAPLEDRRRNGGRLSVVRYPGRPGEVSSSTKQETNSTPSPLRTSKSKRKSSLVFPHKDTKSTVDKLQNKSDVFPK